ncbi:MAG TPA: hypothetical protein VK053_11360 [Jiangellaceae bacterium]|nr:hypothetical protein [Jiangellaceae bacterium]
MTEGTTWTIPAKLAVALMASMLTVGLLGWHTLGGPEEAAHWGLMLSAGTAVAWIAYLLDRTRVMIAAMIRSVLREREHEQIVELVRR